MFVPFGITVCGLDELEGHCETGATHVLSILDPGREEPTAFGRYGEHRRLQLHFHDVIEPLPGQVQPGPEHVEALLAFGRELGDDAARASHLLVHCHAGISRSTAAMTLLLAQARPDRPASEAMAEVARIRVKAWPNLRMIEIGDRLLNRRGELVAAAHARYRAMTMARPELARFMIENGRAREVPDDLKSSF
ncbi:tyrosine phosphatase family protein [Arenibaculum pallidiluteum]|uniref:tyrosine phosphatase family protein n=1 Tax=Arenibaculum pallidiluteum TaxID=2812559 RepID=UPI001A97CC56|nr:protein-tyrosine-phosphatase [Arenibaculum pallidiluteum]